MEQTSRTEISELGEFGLINHLTKNNEIKNVTTVLGIGDDAAVIDTIGKIMLVSTDLLIENIHFDLAYTPLKHLGYKAVAVNVSDIYAMYGTPTQITVSIAVSNRFSVEALEEIYEGIYFACNQYGVDLIGGDTTSSPQGLAISITAIGEASKQEYVQRNSANENDIICVTGDLGAAYCGLLLLEREKQVLKDAKGIKPDLENMTHIVGKILKPEAQKNTIEWLKEKEVVPTSMIDISDGLSSELHHICKASGKGCVIFEEKLPIHDETKTAAMKFGIDATTCALNGGEDYEILFTISQADYEKIKDNAFITPIGYITSADKGLKIHTKGEQIHDLVAQGWQHA